MQPTKAETFTELCGNCEDDTAAKCRSLVEERDQWAGTTRQFIRDNLRTSDSRLVAEEQIYGRDVNVFVPALGSIGCELSDDKKLELFRGAVDGE